MKSPEGTTPVITSTGAGVVVSTQGMLPNGSGAESSGGPPVTPSALERAALRWGSAGVIRGGVT